MVLAAVIPAYKPSRSLINLIQSLDAQSFAAIIVVDDGSGPESQEIFSTTAAFPGVRVLRHSVHLGRGAALKTAFNHVLCELPDAGGVVTASEHHHAEDIERVATALRKRSSSMVLGCCEGVGHPATLAIVHALIGSKLRDIHTTLRGIPAKLLPRLMAIESTGNAFEMEMLIRANQMSFPLIEEPVSGRPSSEFNPLGSLEIYRILLRFSSVSLITALIDNIVFILAQSAGLNILPSQALGRGFAVAFNYWMVRSSVFKSSTSHRVAFPKYLALVIVSGTVSYAGIRLLGAMGIPAIPAKFVVETLLFFVNYVVQRLFIFRPVEAPVAETARPRAILAPVTALIFFALLGIEVYGLRTSDLFSQEIWFAHGLRRFEYYTGAYLAMAVPLLMIVPWMFARLMVALILVLTVLAIGPQPVLATAFFLLSACALGSMLLRAREEPAENHLLATLLGMGVYIFVMTFLARLPVNYPIVWGALLAVPLLLDLRGVRKRFAVWTRAIRDAELRSVPERAAFALLWFVLIAHWFAALTPETSADGLAMHLAVPLDIAANHRMTFEPSRYVWSVMPMGADWCYAIVCVLAGEYAAHLLVWSMLAILAGLLYCLLRRWLASAPSLLLVAVFTTTPLVQLVTGSLFVENFLAAMILGMVSALLRFIETAQTRFLYLAMALGGTAMAIKIGALAFLPLALIFAVAQGSARRRPTWTAYAVALLVLLAAAAPTYAIAYAKTGNPVFPFRNRAFPSPLLDPTTEFVDYRFRQPVNWRTLYDLTFHTSNYYEGQNGSLGFQYLIIVPLALLASVAVTRQGAAGAGWIAFGAAFFILRSEPNARYLYSALPLLFIPFAALLAELAEQRRGLYRLLLLSLIACATLNLWFLPSSSYYHKEFSIAQPFSRAARDRHLTEAVPVRDVIGRYNRVRGNAAVLFTHDSTIAGTAGEVFENHWHQTGTYQRIRQALTVPEMLDLMRSWKVGYFIARKPAPGERLAPKELAQLIEMCAVPEYERGDTYLARLDHSCKLDDTVSRGPVEPVVVARPGFYDDFDPIIVFRGEWSRDESFEGPARHTVSYNDIPGAEAKFAFDGKALNWVFTRAPNRGIADVTIDGASQQPVDLYSADVQWQSVQRFCCFSPGRHVIAIRVTNQTDPRSSGRFVDLDAFVVE